MKKWFPAIIMVMFFYSNAIAQSFVSGTASPQSFGLVGAGIKTYIYTDDHDFNTVQKAAALLQQDIKAVTGILIDIVHAIPKEAGSIIVIGSGGKSAAVKDLIRSKKINTSSVNGKWEAYQLKVVAKPFKDIAHVLVIAGSDRRGTAYGVFELSKQIGVSPWYWWADVPVKKKTALYLSNNLFIVDSPNVKYRGIFINDEAPALSGWTQSTFGGFNSKLYAKVFELILRLKGNYIWPAMWGHAFYDDDSLNIKTADEYGIVIGTSHHEPLMRAHDEWRRYGQGKWNYDSNEVRLKDFWKQGMQRATNEKIVSIGMRGDGDEPMSRETATALLERIVKDQRQIIQEVTHKPASETPQLWALYKEVQDYYDKGMRVPDDVTLLLCDDNWGNIRKLPSLNAAPRKGGYGIYYHFDYVGDPRNYKWLNTNPLPRVWEQMHLAYEHKVTDIWIVNVGDIKPMELPISFFLDYAWNPHRIDAADIQPYTEKWAAAQFGVKYSKEIAGILSKYAKYNGRRKPELLNENTYSFNYAELFTVTNDYKTLLHQAERISDSLPATYRDAFFELVLHPVKACANLQEMYMFTALNHSQAAKNDPAANQSAEKVKQLYENDSLITRQYHGIANGKWNHMMDQTHIGYTYWQQPEHQQMPVLKYVTSDTSTKNHSSTIMEKIDVESTVADSDDPAGDSKHTFFETDGYISMEAAHYSKAFNSNGISWKILPDLGRTGSAMTSLPVTAANQSPGKNAPYLQYDFYTYDSGTVKLQLFFSPTLNFNNDEGLRFAISIDNETPRVMVLNKEDNQRAVWEKWVADNIIIKTSEHTIAKPGRHILKYWMLSPAVVLQKLVVDLGGLKDSYLGPPETRH